MLKNILKLDGATVLLSAEQKSINGGISQACADYFASGVICAFSTPTGCPLINGEQSHKVCGKCCVEV